MGVTFLCPRRNSLLSREQLAYPVFIRSFLGVHNPGATHPQAMGISTFPFPVWLANALSLCALRFASRFAPPSNCSIFAKKPRTGKHEYGTPVIVLLYAGAAQGGPRRPFVFPGFFHGSPAAMARNCAGPGKATPLRDWACSVRTQWSVLSAQCSALGVEQVTRTRQYRFARAV
jgi:hypothetical protein